jgi:preprotein translocase subunit SecE
MTSTNKTKEASLWFGLVIITALAFLCTYYLKFTTPIKIIVWIIWFILFTLIGYFTDKGQAVLSFALEAKTELIKVVWPTRQETIQTTSIVMIMVAVTGFILWAIDMGMMWAIGKITHLG